MENKNQDKANPNIKMEDINKEDPIRVPISLKQDNAIAKTNVINQRKDDNYRNKFDNSKNGEIITPGKPKNKDIILKILDTCLSNIEKCSQKFDYETSGLLLGKIDEQDEHIITRVSDGGENEVRSWASVTPDKTYFDTEIEKAEKKGLVYLGEWHKHPGYLKSPSRGDKNSVRTIFHECPQLTDYIMMIIVKNDEGEYEFYAYYFDRLFTEPLQLDYTVIKSFKKQELDLLRPEIIKRDLNWTPIFPIEKLLIKKHYPTIRLVEDSNGKYWEGELLGYKVYLKRTYYNIIFKLFTGDYKPPIEYEFKTKVLPLYFITLTKFIKKRLSQLLKSLNNYFQKYQITSLVEFCKNNFTLKASKNLIKKIYAKWVNWLVKIYIQSQKTLLYYLIRVEAEILDMIRLKKITPNSFLSGLFQKDKNESKKTENSETINENSQWYSSIKGQTYLARQKKMLDSLEINNTDYQFSLNKNNGNLIFSGFLDRINNLKLKIEYPENFLHNLELDIKIIDSLNTNNLSQRACKTIEGKYELYNIFHSIYQLYDSGGEIREK